MSFLDRIEAVLTGLPEDAPLHDVYDALSDFEDQDVQAVLATRSLTAGGGGGSQTVESDTDPGAVGAGTLWVNTTAISGTDNRPMLVRNDADDGWIPIGLAHYDETGVLRGFVTLTDGAVAIEKKDDQGENVGMLLFRDDVFYISTVNKPIWFSAVGFGGTEWGLSAPSGAEKFGAIAVPDDAEVEQDQRIHWYDVNSHTLRFKQMDNMAVLTSGKSASMTDDGVAFLGVDKPVVPLTIPVVQDVIDALVTLGLVTQSD